MFEINNFRRPVTLAWFSIQIRVNSKIFKLSLNLSFTHLRAQIAFKGDLSSIMLKERFNNSLKASNLETQKHTKRIEIHQSQITDDDLLFPNSLRGQRLEVVGERENGRARGRQSRGEGMPARKAPENRFNLHSVSADISNWSRGSRGKN